MYYNQPYYFYASTSVLLKCPYLADTVYLQVLVSASNLFLESCKHIALCCLLKLNSIKLIFQCLRNSGAFALLTLDCVAQYFFLLASFTQTHFTVMVAGSFMHLGIAYSEFIICAKILQVFHHYFYKRWHLDRYMNIKQIFKRKKKNSSKFLFALLDGLSKHNQSLVGKNFLWFVYGICYSVSSCFC